MIMVGKYTIIYQLFLWSFASGNHRKDPRQPPHHGGCTEWAPPQASKQMGPQRFSVGKKKSIVVCWAQKKKDFAKVGDRLVFFFGNGNDHFDAQEFKNSKVCAFNLSIYHHWLTVSMLSMYEIWHDVATVHPRFKQQSDTRWLHCFQWKALYLQHSHKL